MPTGKKKPSLSQTNPEIAKEAHGWDPSKITSGSNKIVEWKCSLGHIFSGAISKRTSRSDGCPFCSGRKTLKGFNDLATTHPALAEEAHGWNPTTLTAGSHKYKEWRCSVGHVTRTMVKNRALGGNKCRICMNQEVLTGFNDLASSFPEIANSLVDQDPRIVIPGSNKKYSWKCALGHIFKQSVNQRISGQGCSICAGKQLLVGFNDLATTHPQISSEAYGWDPREIFGASHLKRNFRCPDGHIFRASVKDRTLKESGCPYCSKTGFNPGKDGYLYFLEHVAWNMYQIGITNNLDQRMKSHSHNGWNLIEVRGPIDGLLALKWESSILRMLKQEGADLANSKIAGKFDGYSEAWSKNTFEVNSIKKLMKMTEKFENDS